MRWILPISVLLSLACSGMPTGTPPPTPPATPTPAATPVPTPVIATPVAPVLPSYAIGQEGANPVLQATRAGVTEAVYRPAAGAAFSLLRTVDIDGDGLPEAAAVSKTAAQTYPTLIVVIPRVTGGYNVQTVDLEVLDSALQWRPEGAGMVIVESANGSTTPTREIRVIAGAIDARRLTPAVPVADAAIARKTNWLEATWSGCNGKKFKLKDGLIYWSSPISATVAVSSADRSADAWILGSTGAGEYSWITIRPHPSSERKMLMNFSADGRNWGGRCELGK